MPSTTLARSIGADAVVASDRDWTVDLALFRLVFLGGIALPFAWRALRWTQAVMPDLPRDAWVPISFFALIPPSVLANAELAWWLAAVDCGLIVLAFFGVLTRWTLATATLLSLYVFGLTNNLGKVDHNHHIVWFMALLAVGPSACFLSVDAIVAGIRTADRGGIDPRVPPGTALATFRGIWLLFGLVYLGPGVAKLASAVTQEWSSAANLRLIVWEQWFVHSLYHPGYTPPSWVGALPSWIFVTAGIAAIAFEIGFVCLVFVRAARPFLIVAGLFFHAMNGLVLAIWFGFLVPAYAALIDWVAVGRRLVGDSALLILYDGNCRVCRRAIAILRSLDALDTMTALPGTTDDPRRREYADVTDEMLAHDIWVLEGGRRSQGFDAYRRIALRLPLLWPIAVLMTVPGVASVGRRIYRRVADARTCRIREPPLAVTAAPRQSFRGVIAVAAALVASELVVSGLRIALPTTPVPVWPFDVYPTFASIRPAEKAIWEPRLVLTDGRELELSPRAWARAFGWPATCGRVGDGILREVDPERRRTRSLEAAALLWRGEPAESRTQSTAVAVYEARYTLGPVPKRVADTPLYRFTLDELASVQASS